MNFANKKVWVAGHTGMVGSHLVQRLKLEPEINLLLTTRQELNLLDQSLVNQWVSKNKPDYIFVAAARVGGILENATYPVQFLYENLMIASNIMNAAYNAGVKKLIYPGSNCIYPQLAPQPLKEESLLSGSLEPTNEWYALAKIAGLKLCQAYRKQYNCDFISVMPSNLYGAYDNFDLTSSHVIPALMRKAHEAKIKNQSSFLVWGSGNAIREFLFVEDLADGLVFLFKNYSAEGPINIGTGLGISIKELAHLIAGVVGFKGEIKFDTSKPDGTPIKINDISKINQLGWNATTPLVEGLKKTYQAFLAGQGRNMGRI